MQRDSVESMLPKKGTARFAGLLYLLSSVVGLPGLVIVPNALVVRGDPTATAAHIIAAQPLFRFGLASELVSMTMFIFVVLTLYRLFKGVSERLASLMAILYLISVPILMINVLSGTLALRFLTDAPLGVCVQQASARRGGI